MKNVSYKIMYSLVTVICSKYYKLFTGYLFYHSTKTLLNYRLNLIDLVFVGNFPTLVWGGEAYKGINRPPPNVLSADRGVNGSHT